jgi:hypothetical protein
MTEGKYAAILLTHRGDICPASLWSAAELWSKICEEMSKILLKSGELEKSIWIDSETFLTFHHRHVGVRDAPDGPGGVEERQDLVSAAVERRQHPHPGSLFPASTYLPFDSKAWSKSSLDLRNGSLCLLKKSPSPNPPFGQKKSH